VTPRPPLDGVDVVLTDLDGVVYRGKGAIPHAVESLTAASEHARIGYITNNASRRPQDVAEHLESFGLRVGPDDVVTSSQAGVRLLQTLVPAGSTILVVGGLGLTSIVEGAGFVVTDSADDHPAAVIQGFSPDLGWKQLAEASFALADPDMPWVATNMDWSIPVERGIAPGNGTLVAAVHNAVGRMPVVAGKPERAIFDAAVDRFGGSSPIFIGDRLDTDIKGANDAGIPSVLVLTGIDQAKQVLAADARSRPTWVLADLRGLSEPYPVTERNDTDAVRRVTVGGATVRMERHVVRVEQSGDDPMNLLRAGATLIWESGLAIYGLDVDPALYGGE
jgi:glycerol-1-phosphatase